MITIANAETMYQYLFREAVGHWVRVPLSSGPSAQGLRYRIRTGDAMAWSPSRSPSEDSLSTVNNKPMAHSGSWLRTSISSPF
jgi:hypothetical protein